MRRIGLLAVNGQRQVLDPLVLIDAGVGITIKHLAFEPSHDGGGKMKMLVLILIGNLFIVTIPLWLIGTPAYMVALWLVLFNAPFANVVYSQYGNRHGVD
ncbi:hypothetical protein SEA_ROBINSPARKLES_79 [Gordonia phage RobinSparkles]|nr:hypothetical protein SEA_ROBINSPARKLES_79 [Gordonia phage RobinSparkles]